MGPILFFAILIGAVTIIAYGYWTIMVMYASSPRRGPVQFDLWAHRKQIIIWFSLLGMELILMVLSIKLRPPV
jgi:hypothetical protein